MCMCVGVWSLSAKWCLTLATPWTVTHQAPLSMGWPRQEYWSSLPFCFPGDLPDPGIEPMSAALTGRLFTAEPPGKPIRVCVCMCVCIFVSWVYVMCARVWVWERALLRQSIEDCRHTGYASFLSAPLSQAYSHMPVPDHYHILLRYRESPSWSPFSQSPTSEMLHAQIETQLSCVTPCLKSDTSMAYGKSRDYSTCSPKPLGSSYLPHFMPF